MMQRPELPGWEGMSNKPFGLSTNLRELSLKSGFARQYASNLSNSQREAPAVSINKYQHPNRPVDSSKFNVRLDQRQVEVMKNDECDVNVGQGQVRFFDDATMNNNRFQQEQCRPVDADLHKIRGKVHVTPATEGGLMDANRGQGQVRLINADVIDSAIDQGNARPTQTEITGAARNKEEVRPMDTELIK